MSLPDDAVGLQMVIVGLTLIPVTISVLRVGIPCIVVEFPGRSHYLQNIQYSKTCVKRPLKNKQNKGLNDNW